MLFTHLSGFCKMPCKNQMSVKMTEKDPYIWCNNRK